MKRPVTLLDPKLWKRLYYFLSFKNSKPAQELLLETKIKSEDMQKWLVLLKDLKAPVEIKKEKGQFNILSTGDEKTIHQDWSWQNWMKLNVLVDEVLKKELKGDLKEIAFSVKNELMKHPFYANFEEFKKRIHSFNNAPSLHEAKISNHNVEKIEQAILESKALRIIHCTEKDFLIKPWKLVFLEGSLSLIGEDKFDKCLTALKIDEITDCQTINNWKSLVSERDVESFIRGVRGIAEVEERLILKIKHPEFLEINPAHHFLAKPCMITNPYGDLIWSAYVEVCSQLFDWLITLEGHVEILDPVSLKQKYLHYCEEKFRKMA